METKDMETMKGYWKEIVFTITHYKKALSHIVRTINKNEMEKMEMDKNGRKWNGLKRKMVP